MSFAFDQLLRPVFTLQSSENTFTYFINVTRCWTKVVEIILWPDASFLRTLDSSIKRNTAVIKKLKQINEEQRESTMEDLKSVNLSKFVSEAVAAICEAKLKTSDIQAAVQVIYSNFRTEFYAKVLSTLS